MCNPHQYHYFYFYLLLTWFLSARLDSLPLSVKLEMESTSGVPEASSSSLLERPMQSDSFRHNSKDNHRREREKKKFRKWL